MRLAKSIKWRIQLWYGLILVGVLSALGATALQLEKTKTYRQIDNEMVRRARAVADAIRMSTLRAPRRAPPRTAPGELSPRPPAQGDDAPAAGGSFRLQPRDEGLFEDNEGFYFAAWTRDGRAIAHSGNAPARPFDASPAPPPDGRQMPPVMHGTVRELNYITGQQDRIIVGRDIAAEQGELRLTEIRLVAVSAIVLVIALLGGWWVSARSLRPIDAISTTAVKIAAGDLAQRIDVADTDSELGRLAAVLNSTFARLESAFAQQRQFASDVAHELRTPVSILITQTQSALKRERTAPDYRETIESCERAAQRMRRLIESLLELARFDAGQEVLQHSTFDLATVIAESVGLVQPLAEQQSVRITTELAPLQITGDPDRLGQVLNNLLANAIRFNHPGGEVQVTARRDGGLITIAVRDTGAGIAAEDLPRVFGRFYRADKSRGGGHTGLGLAICKAIVEAHGGGIDAASELGQGSCFTVRLPAHA